jgi:excisionase family DNA binding protein
MTVSEQFLTVSEVAERLRVSEETIRRWLRDGRLFGVHLGSRKGGWRVSERDLEAFLRERRTTKDSKR